MNSFRFVFLVNKRKKEHLIRCGVHLPFLHCDSACLSAAVCVIGSCARWLFAVFKCSACFGAPVTDCMCPSICVAARLFVCVWCIIIQFAIIHLQNLVRRFVYKFLDYKLFVFTSRRICLNNSKSKPINRQKAINLKINNKVVVIERSEINRDFNYKFGLFAIKCRCQKLAPILV